MGDTVGVMRKEDGSLHFFVNSTDLGCAAQGVPANVYGVIDLFGQCAQVTIVSGSEQNVEAELTNTMNGKTALMFTNCYLLWDPEITVALLRMFCFCTCNWEPGRP